MLTPEYLEDLPGSIVDLYRQAEDAILADMARRISNMDLFSPAADWQYRKLREAGALSDDILEELSRLTHKTKTELKKLMQEAANVSLGYDESVYEGVGITGEPLSSSEPLRRILNAGYAKTAQTMRNLTGTTARTASQQFERALDQAWMKVNTGGFSTDQAVRDAVKELSARGVESITYRKDGEVTRTDTLEVATRRAVVTGVNQTCGELQLERAKEMGADLMELTAHEGARPSHAEWQGQIVSLSGQPGYLSLDDIGYGDVTGFKGANCRHDWNPWFEGMPRTWTPEALAKLNEKRYEYNGKKLTQYEASQMQRRLETSMRDLRRQLVADKATGNEEKFTADAVKYRALNEKYRAFSEKAGLPLQQDRMRVEEFDSKTAREAERAAEKEVAKYSSYHYNEDGTIVVTDDWRERQHPMIPLKYKPFAVVDTTSQNDRQRDRTYFDGSGSQTKQISNGPHGNPKKHPYGKHGEHAHDIVLQPDGKTIRPRRDLTDSERKENADIL